MNKADLLRLALLVAGAALIVGIYLWETRKRRRAAEWALLRESPPPAYADTVEPRNGAEPAFADADWLDLSIASGMHGEAAQTEIPDRNLESLRGLTATPEEPRAGPASGARVAGAEAGEAGELIIVVTVLAHPGHRFAGAAIHAALADLGMRPGAMKIYHRSATPGAGETLFSAVNIVNPGTLDPHDAADLRTPGLALILRLPGPPDAMAAYDAMLDSGHRLAAVLDGTLCDATHSTLSTQAVNHLRERIAEFGRRQLLHD